MADAWTVVVTREPEFDDRSRNQALALHVHDAGCCPGCGLHQSIIDDPEHNHFTFEESKCPVCAAKDARERVLAERDRKFDERNPDLPPRKPRPGDGERVFLRQLTPLEVLQRQLQQKEVHRG